MIPKERKRQAIIVTSIAFGLMVVGMVMGAVWVLMYMPQ